MAKPFIPQSVNNQNRTARALSGRVRTKNIEIGEKENQQYFQTATKDNKVKLKIVEKEKQKYFQNEQSYEKANTTRPTKYLTPDKDIKKPQPSTPYKFRFDQRKETLEVITKQTVCNDGHAIISQVRPSAEKPENSDFLTGKRKSHYFLDDAPKTSTSLAQPPKPTLGEFLKANRDFDANAKADEGTNPKPFQTPTLSRKNILNLEHPLQTRSGEVILPATLDEVKSGLANFYTAKILFPDSLNNEDEVNTTAIQFKKYNLDFQSNGDATRLNIFSYANSQQLSIDPKSLPLFRLKDKTNPVKVANNDSDKKNNIHNYLSPAIIKQGRKLFELRDKTEDKTDSPQLQTPSRFNAIDLNSRGLPIVEEQKTLSDQTKRSPSKSRKISQKQVMGKSAKESFAEFVQFLKSDPNAKLTRHEIAELEDILANNKLEWRHLIPHAVAGEKSQTADNLFAGTDYANSYDLCVEQALLGKNGQLKNSNFHIRCKETYLNGDDKNNIGIRREYRIINLKNAKTITIEYPTFINQKPSINCIPAFSELINNELE